jgi:hypothetical protein
VVTSGTARGWNASAARKGAGLSQTNTAKSIDANFHRQICNAWVRRKYFSQSRVKKGFG